MNPRELAERLAASMTPTELRAAAEHDADLKPHADALDIERRAWAYDFPQVTACIDLALVECRLIQPGPRAGRERRAAMRAAVEVVMGGQLIGKGNANARGKLSGVATCYDLPTPHPVIKGVRIGWITLEDGRQVEAMSFDVTIPERLGGGEEIITITRPTNHGVTL